MNRNLLLQTLQTIEASASYVTSVDACRFEAGLIAKEAAEAILALCETCLTDLTRAFGEGAEKNETVRVVPKGQGKPVRMTLGELRSQCVELRTRANDHLYLCRIRQALLQANVWVSDLQEPESLSLEQRTFAAETGKALLQVLQDAHDAGVSDRINVTMNGALVTLAEVKAFGESVAAVGAVDAVNRGSQSIRRVSRRRRRC